MEYDVISTADLDELIAKVNERLKQGWQLQGGIAVMRSLDDTYNQAIVKKPAIQE